ncbi:MAG TPA: hypothetical protein VHM25_01660 [Polyangiaceae bacterium]|nr:hypothetical protein [Polyangiaceae bacterium]
MTDAGTGESSTAGAVADGVAVAGGVAGAGMDGGGLTAWVSAITGVGCTTGLAGCAMGLAG